MHLQGLTLRQKANPRARGKVVKAKAAERETKHKPLLLRTADTFALLTTPQQAVAILSAIGLMFAAIGAAMEPIPVSAAQQQPRADTQSSQSNLWHPLT